jgi:hypothetical protein
MYILFKYLFEPHFHSMLNFKEHSGFTLVLVQIMEFLLKASFLVRSASALLPRLLLLVLRRSSSSSLFVLP